MYIRTTEGSAQEPLQPSLGDAAASSREAERRFKRVAELVTEGLKVAKDAIPHLSTNAQQDLLRFMTSLLESFFPRGHGLIDAQGKVLRQSKIGTVAVPVIAKDGSRWPFEHRVRIFLDDKIPDRNVAGVHASPNFSVISLFTRKMYRETPSRTVIVILHEMTHMMLAMIQRFERRFGAETAGAFLSRNPWRLLDLNGFAEHRRRLERHVLDLLRILPIPMDGAELAASLVGEALAFIFGDIVDEAIAQSAQTKKSKRGPIATYGFSPKTFIKYYVLERGFAVTEKQLDSPDARQVFARMTKDVDALATALRTHLDS
jgi:hypothetical protein